jgi:hypothetical protein
MGKQELTSIISKYWKTQTAPAETETRISTIYLQLSNTKYTKRKIQTQRPKDWDLAAKETRNNTKTQLFLQFINSINFDLL